LFGEDYVGSEAAKSHLEQIKRCLQVQPGTRRRNHEKLEAEQTILDICKSAEEDLLSELVTLTSNSDDCSMAKIISFFQDDGTRTARTDFLRTLCHDRVSDLNVQAKSVIIQALLVMKLSSCDYAEEAVENILLDTEGDDLSVLKSIQDSGNVHSIHKLVYQDLQHKDTKNSILKHFLGEAVQQVAYRTLFASPHFTELLDKCRRKDCLPDDLSFLGDGEEELRRVEEYNGQSCRHAWLKIFTDIDDTLECSGGNWPAGIDTRYPRHTPYPGVTAFYRELQYNARDLIDADVPTYEMQGQIVALSARPHLSGSIMEDRVIKKFEAMRKDYGLHCLPALLCGAVDAGAKFLVSGGSEEGLWALGTKKFEKFEEFFRLYPEFRLVFIGDNGQADYMVGQMCAKSFHSMWSRSGSMQSSRVTKHISMT
jgi:hypothetical protein